MKNLFLKSFFVFVFLFSFLTPSFASYEITDNDIIIIEGIEAKLYRYIDNSNVTAEMMSSRLQNLLDTRTYTPRLSMFLEIIIADIDYEYFTDEIPDEYYVMTEDDCYDDEYFDAEDEFCYGIEETSDTEDFASDSDDNHFGGHVDVEAPEVTEAVYTIKGDVITLLTGTEDPTHQEIWTLYTKAIPSYFRETVEYFNVTNEPENDVDASVFRDEVNHSAWHIHVNRASYFDEEGTLDITKVHTLIHEYTHILTLGDGQIDEISPELDSDILVERFKNNCKTYFIHEGCLNESSYLNSFISQFWSKEDLENALAAGGAENFNNPDIETLYTGRETDFVTEYAATSEVEDIAESFGFFVLSPKPTGTTIADKKILFFYNYPELVKVRDVIRNRIK